ncbi:hypothetical protein ABG768_001186 [Culter alburnus]|uniref:AIG1-type G domain-containing protein n=1 Tax=Culter alburnus TaxID=194366 RepID=A0AAW2B8P1_CULAL
MSIMLLGLIGSGKSTSGNTIIGVRETFEEDFSPVAVTRVCNSTQTVVDGQTITVIDTVGLSDTSVKAKDAETQIEKMFTHHSVDVFLLVIKLGGAMETRNVVQWIQDNFGAKALKHSIVLFTHGDQLHGPVERYLNKCETLRSIVDQCSGGFHVFNNKDEDRSQVTELLEKINSLREKNGYRRYTEQDKKTQKELILKKCDAAAAVAAAAEAAVEAAVGAAGATAGAVIVLGAAAAGATVGAAVGGAAAVEEAVAEARAATAAGAGVVATVGAAALTVGKAAIIGAARCAALAAVTAFSAGVYLWYAK